MGDSDISSPLVGGSGGSGGGGVVPGGTGFTHITGGAQDGTARAVDVSSADATGTLAAARFPALTGDVTTAGGALAATIATNAVTNAKAAQMAANSLKGNNTGGVANAADLTVAQVLALVSPLTTKGDVLGFTTVNARVPIGSDTQVATADSTQGPGWKWAAPAASIQTTKGDLAGFSTVAARVPVGTDGQYLASDSAQTLGIGWKTSAAITLLDHTTTDFTFSNSAAEQTIYSFSVPGGTLGTALALRLTLDNTFVNNTGAARTIELKVKYGATTLHDSTGTMGAFGATTVTAPIEIWLNSDGTTGTQRVMGRMSLGDPALAGTTTGYGGIGGTMSWLGRVFGGTSSEDSTAAKTLTVTITLDAATATATWHTRSAYLELIS